MRDMMGALKTLVETKAPITALVGARVFVNRLPQSVLEAEATFNPQKMLVLKMSGGFQKLDTLPTDDPTVNVLCYGETDFEADRVRRAVWEEFVSLERETHDGVLFHHINPAGGPVSLTDPDIVWPAVSQVFNMKADVKET